MTQSFTLLIFSCASIQHAWSCKIVIDRMKNGELSLVLRYILFYTWIYFGVYLVDINFEG